jgi:hypothetical protein
MTKIVRTALMSLGFVATLAASLAASPARADQDGERAYRYRQDPYYGQTYYGHQPYYYRGQPQVVAPPHVAYRAPVLNDWQIGRRLQRQGYNAIGPLRHTNGYIHARATDNWGRHVRLTVSPVTGQVVDARYHW